MYLEKLNLCLTYHWQVSDLEEMNAIIIDGEYETFSSALEAINKVAPKWNEDDGNSPVLWNDEPEEDDFWQLCSLTTEEDANRYFLAQLRPVK